VDLVSVAVVVAAYFIGSIDFGVIVPRLLGHDIYQHGSGNPGATNVLRSLGRRVAAFVVLGDVTKGFVAAMLAGLVGGEAAGFAGAFAAVTGHCFPVWHRFRGGKGVAAAGGAALWLAPLLAGSVIVVWVVVVALVRRASIASLTVVVVWVPGMLLFGYRGAAVAWSAAMAALIVVRHHDNIRRLLGGAEHPIDSA
jgi:acyl phosphate:glycerol-3-phosphate acyltransferase